LDNVTENHKVESMGSQALHSALKVLRCFTAAQPEWGVTELAQKTALTKGHVCKILAGFVEEEFLLRDAVQRRYRVGPRAFLLGAGFTNGSEVVKRAEPLLRELTNDVNLTATLNMSDSSKVLFVMAVNRAAPHNSWPAGSHLPLHATAAGKVHAAFMGADHRKVMFSRPLRKVTASTICDIGTLTRQFDETRRTGFAYTYGESTREVGGVAAPVFGDRGDVVGAISLLYRLDHGPRTPDVELARIVKHAANQLSRAIGAERYPYN
jgi:DNA-binding IclR family transcriptional regulator